MLLVGVLDAGAVVTTGAPLLGFPLGARVWSMGTNGVADNTEPANIFFNPANVVAGEHVYFQGVRWDLAEGVVDDAWVRGFSAGFSHRLSGGLILAADLTYGRLEFGETETIPIGDPPMLGPLLFVPTNETFTVTLGVGSSFGNRNEWRAGFAGKRFWEAFPISLDTNSVSIDRPQQYAFDFGVTVVVRRSWGDWEIVPGLGAALVNAGSDITSDLTGESDPLPTRVHFGGSVLIASTLVTVIGAPVPLVSFVCNVDGNQRLHDQPFIWGTGLELSVAKMLFLRTGFNSDPGEDFESYSSAWGVGLGVPVQSVHFRFDYTHTSSSLQPDIYGMALHWQL